jgi:hypothetical protein
MQKIPPPPTPEPALPDWVRETVTWIDANLNWLDLVTFLLGVLLLLVFFLILMRKKKKKHEEELTQMAVEYEKGLGEMKRIHMQEIHRAEGRIKEFKQKLTIVEADYQESVTKLEKKYEQELIEIQTSHSKRVQSIEKGHAKALSNTDVSVFELKKEIANLRKKQLVEVNQFQSEIETLKTQIKSLHENHAKEIESSEMKITDLRKQLNALIYKV